MDHLNTEAEEFRTHIARWVDERLVPQAEALDHAGVFPHELFRELGALGYYGAMYPEAVGGSDSRIRTLASRCCEELARASIGFAAGGGVCRGIDCDPPHLQMGQPAPA